MRHLSPCSCTREYKTVNQINFRLGRRDQKGTGQFKNINLLWMATFSELLVL